MIVAAAWVLYCTFNHREQKPPGSFSLQGGRAEVSQKHGNLSPLANLPRSVCGHQMGFSTTRNLPSRNTRAGSAASSPLASKIAESPQGVLWNSETPTCEIRNKIQLAISDMQSALQDELQEDEMKIHGVLGQGLSALCTMVRAAL